jgi:predicted nucleic acid-binding protein
VRLTESRLTRVYLDNCCFNRPFDNQTSFVIRQDTDAKLYVQELIDEEKLELVWSFILDYENAENPYEEVRSQIAEWKNLAITDIGFSNEIAATAAELMTLGLRQKDAAHVACAIHADAVYFLTTDKIILNKTIAKIVTISPVNFVRRYLNAE